jgi:diphthamide biosynthesis methyltransferase
MNGKNQKSILSCKTAAIILGLLASENSVVRSATLKEMEGADIGSKAELLSALRMWMDEA